MRAALDSLSTLFSRRGLKPLLVGGYALQAFGVFRQTMDIDLLLADESADEMDAGMREAGYELQGRAPGFARYRHPENALPDVDLIFVDPATCRGLVAESLPLGPGEPWWRVPSLPHLVALKLHALLQNPRRKARDTADIVDLARANPATLAGDDIRLLCEQYGPPDFFTELERLL